MSTRNLRHGLFAIAFLVALLAPLLDLAIDLLPDPPLVENRRPAPLPAASALLDDPVGTVRAAAAAFRDRFGGRAALVTGYNHLLERLFDDPGNVLVGNDGWLYLEHGVRADVDNPVAIVRDLCGRAGMADDELARWVEAFRRNHRELARRGIGYVLVIAPNKHTVHPEPLDLPAGCPGRASRLDHLREALHRVDGLVFADLVTPLRQAAAAGEELYHRTDSHWNGLGAARVYAALGALPALSMMSTEVAGRIRLAPRAGFRGDLVALLGEERREVTTDLDIVGAAARTIDHPALGVPHSPAQAPATWASAADNHRHALVFHDSFFHGDLNALLAESFHRSTFVWGAFPDLDLGAVEAIAPDVVIHQMVERTLLAPGLWRGR